jgi:hypothetical protein
MRGTFHVPSSHSAGTGNRFRFAFPGRGLDTAFRLPGLKPGRSRNNLRSFGLPVDGAERSCRGTAGAAC